MNYEEYYNELSSELERSASVLKEYDDLEAHFMSSTHSRVRYESYVLSSMPVGIVDIVYILTSGTMTVSFDIELKNTLKNNTRLQYTLGVSRLFDKERVKILDIFKSLTEIANDDVLLNILNGIRNDLSKNEDRILKLKELMRR